MNKIDCNKLTLTQGVFLSLIKDIAIPEPEKRANSDGGKYTNKKFVLLFWDCINTKCSLGAFSFDKYNEKTSTVHSKNTVISDYLRCERDLTPKLYPDKNSIIDNLRKSSINDIYQTCLEKIKLLIKQWLCKDEKQLKRLISGILHIIQNDDTIDKQSLFYICGQDCPIKKEELSDNLLEEPLRVSFPEFLLGIWMFLVVRKINKTGKDTYKYLFPPTDNPNTPRKYNGLLDGKYKRPIEIICENQGDKETPVEQEAPVEQKTPVEQETPEEQKVPEEQKSLESKRQQAKKKWNSETAVITKELDYQYCCFCEKWKRLREDIKENYPGKCDFHKSPRKPMEEACEYFEPNYGRMSLASMGAIDVL